MALDFSNIKAITIPEGTVKYIKIGDNIVWSGSHNLTISVTGSEYLITWSVTYGDTKISNPSNDSIYEVEDGVTISADVYDPEYLVAPSLSVRYNIITVTNSNNKGCIISLAEQKSSGEWSWSSDYTIEANSSTKISNLKATTNYKAAFLLINSYIPKRTVSVPSSIMNDDITISFVGTTEKQSVYTSSDSNIVTTTTIPFWYAYGTMSNTSLNVYFTGYIGEYASEDTDMDTGPEIYERLREAGHTSSSNLGFALGNIKQSGSTSILYYVGDFDSPHKSGVYAADDKIYAVTRDGAATIAFDKNNVSITSVTDSM